MQNQSAAQVTAARLRHARAMDSDGIGAYRAQEQQLESHFHPAAHRAAGLCSKEAH